MPEKHSFHHLPLRKLGFEYVPAVDIRHADMPSGSASRQRSRRLSRTYTIRGTIARAYLRRPCGRRLGW